MDETLSGIDEHIQKDLIINLKDLFKNGIVIIVSHNDLTLRNVIMSIVYYRLIY